jgi:hypothetical protein
MVPRGGKLDISSRSITSNLVRTESGALCGLTNFPLRPHLDLLRPGRFQTCKAVEPLSQYGLSLKTLKFLVSRPAARATVATPANDWGRDSLPCL